MAARALRSGPLRAWWFRARRWSLVLCLAIVWEAASRLGLIDPILLPSLSATLARGWVLLTNGRLLSGLAASFGRVVVGFCLAASLAFPVGIALGLYPPLEAMSAVLLNALRPLSPPAWIPLAILWFGIGIAPAIFIIFIGTFFSLVVGTAAATRAVDPQLVKAALTLGATRWQSIRFVVLLSLLPALLTQMRVGLGLAWMCVIAAEMVAVRWGLGFLMIEARNLFRTDDVIVGMMTIGVVGLATDALLSRVERVACRWRATLSPSRFYATEEPPS